MDISRNMQVSQYIRDMTHGGVLKRLMKSDSLPNMSTNEIVLRDLIIDESVDKNIVRPECKNGYDSDYDCRTKQYSCTHNQVYYSDISGINSQDLNTDIVYDCDITQVENIKEPDVIIPPSNEPPLMKEEQQNPSENDEEKEEPSDKEPTPVLVVENVNYPSEQQCLNCCTVV